MTKVGKNISLEKLNLYRAGVNQPPLDNPGNLGTVYCQDMIDIQQNRLQADRTLFSRVMSPDKAAANNLFSFLANRLNGSFTNLGCGDLLGIKNPVTLQQKNGVVVDATFFGKGTQATPSPTAGNGNGNGNGATGVTPTRPNDAIPSTTSTPGAPTAPSATARATGTGTPAAQKTPTSPAPTTATGSTTPTTPNNTPTGQSAPPAPNPQVDPNKAGDGSPPTAGKF